MRSKRSKQAFGTSGSHILGQSDEFSTQWQCRENDSANGKRLWSLADAYKARIAALQSRRSPWRKSRANPSRALRVSPSMLRRRWIHPNGKPRLGSVDQFKSLKQPRWEQSLVKPFAVALKSSSHSRWTCR